VRLVRQGRREGSMRKAGPREWMSTTAAGSGKALAAMQFNDRAAACLTLTFSPLSLSLSLPLLPLTPSLPHSFDSFVQSFVHSSRPLLVPLLHLHSFLITPRSIPPSPLTIESTHFPQHSDHPSSATPLQFLFIRPHSHSHLLSRVLHCIPPCSL
jgi:hypothetical protein